MFGYARPTMRFSKLLIATLREDPADAEVPSHRLLARAGFVFKTASGIYTYAPLMWRTLKKIYQIVREEIDRGGGQEMMMPILQPKEMWQSSGRWDRYVTDGIMFSLQDRRDTDLCLGPTHEEVVTAFVDSMVSSYKQLPINLYQIQDKFRDEIRPRFGIMRSREFIMMDAYSFDEDQAGLDIAYQKMAEAYRRIFLRCELKFSVVQADAGAIGGSGSEEFMVLADTGEDAIITCSGCGYAANVEKAESSIPLVSGGEPKAMEQHATADVRSVEQLVEFFDMPASHMAKTMLYTAVHADREETIAVLMRGDLVINEVKLCNALDCLAVKLAEEKVIVEVTGAELGFAGPVGLRKDIRLLADASLREQSNLLVGCNKTGYHNLNVNLGRDCTTPEYHDLRSARVGENCANCGEGLGETRGIEVGHIFKLGQKYSKAMGATFMGRDGKPTPFTMGCYGIGVSRTAAAAVEQNHDDKGIIWPAPIAPFEVVVAIVDVKRSAQVELAEEIYLALLEAGIDACLDDRKMSPGSKFKDLELMGFPLQVTVGRRADDRVVEFIPRRSGEKQELPIADVLGCCQKFLLSFQAK